MTQSEAWAKETELHARRQLIAFCAFYFPATLWYVQEMQVKPECFPKHRHFCIEYSGQGRKKVGKIQKIFLEFFIFFQTPEYTSWVGFQILIQDPKPQRLDAVVTLSQQSWDKCPHSLSCSSNLLLCSIHIAGILGACLPSPFLTSCHRSNFKKKKIVLKLIQSKRQFK